MTASPIRLLDLAPVSPLRSQTIYHAVGYALGADSPDTTQLFTQWIFHAAPLPATVEERFVVYADSLVRTYRALGIAAEHRPINDIHVAGRKIGGTGAARTDGAEAGGGSLP